MIYEYEAKVLQYINNVIPEIKEATYAKEFDLFLSMVKVIKFPAFYYVRESTQWNFPKIFKVLVDGKYFRFKKIEQDYVGRIYVSSTKDTLRIANALAFNWDNDSYIEVPWLDDKITVALRLLYIKTEEERKPSDTKGSLKYVEFSWRSQIFLDDHDMGLEPTLVENVRIFMDEEGTKIVNNDNLIKVI